MEFSSGRKRKQKTTVVSLYTNGEKVKHRLQLYKGVPTDEITLEDFEKFAVDRLKLLRDVENVSIRFKRGSDDYKAKMEKSLKDFLPFYHKEPPDEKVFVVRQDMNLPRMEYLEQQQNERRKDYISHFILRLAFSRSEDLRRWFLTQEMDLFRYRFLLEKEDSIAVFLDENQLQFAPICKDTLSKEIKEALTATLQSFILSNHDTVDNTNFFKVPFTDVLDLVKNRRVFLHQGSAFVPQHELVSIIVGLYRSELSHSLTLTSRKLPYLEEDTRLLPMLKNLSSAYIGDSYSTKKVANGDKLTLNEIDQSSKISFPLCMRHLHDGVRKEHHLKHFGRLQYGLFLKAAGLSLDEALIFWRNEFTKVMDVDKFEKQYAYNVRHSFGKEGKRADYTPYSCLKIITTNQPGPGDYHGCPFKHSDADVLRARLKTYKVPTDTINEIVELVKKQHFQIACSRYFEATHKQENGTASINHPNQYFDESRKVLTGGKTSSNVTKPAIKVKTEPVQNNSPSVQKKETDNSNLDVTLEDFEEQMDFT